MKDKTSPSLVILLLSYYFCGVIVPIIALRFISFYKVCEILSTYGFVGNGKVYTFSIPILFSCKTVESKGCFNIYGVE